LYNGQRYRFLFGLDGSCAPEISGLNAGEQVVLERRAGDLLLNRLPVQRFYQRTLQGVRELAETGWSRLRHGGKPASE
jgi:hypothetical protein